jgi:hypothetical protein
MKKNRNYQAIIPGDVSDEGILNSNIRGTLGLNPTEEPQLPEILVKT